MIACLRTMRMRAFFIAMAFSVLSMGWVAANDGESPAQAWRRARELMDAGEAEKAGAVFDRLLRAQPNHNIFRLGRARAYLAMGRADEAAADYAALLQKFPDEPELRSEAATAARAAGRGRQAEELDAPPPVTDIRAARLAATAPPPPARRAELPERQKRTFLSGVIRSGILYDSNANQGPASNLFSIGDLQIEVPGAERKGGMGAYLGASVDLLHRLGETPWSLVADAHMLVRANANRDLAENRTREWQWGRVATGLRFQTGRNFFEVRLKGEIFDYQLKDNVSAIGPELTYARAATERIHLITQLGGDIRIFKQGAFRNGFYAQAGQYLRIAFGEGKHLFQIGGKYLGNYAHAKRPSYHGYEFLARLTLSASEKLQISPHIGFTRELYRKPATVLEQKLRRDNRFRAGLDVSYQVGKNLSLEANVQYIRNNSRSSLYRYRQFVTGGGMAWNF